MNLSEKVVVGGAALVMLMLPLFADFSLRACGADFDIQMESLRKWDRIAPKCYIQSDTTNPAGQ